MIPRQPHEQQQELRPPEPVTALESAPLAGLSFDKTISSLAINTTAPLPPPNSEIQCLAQDTIQRISAEQAISDLSSIVKELVDNSLDAESTTIKIRLFGQGLHIIEVSDDGCGVPPSSLPYMATRHATSKISSIDDIYTGTGLTMGFRGEALFSMACVSKELVVASRTDSDELATKMVFGKDGLPLPNVEQFPRKVGTTVAVVQPYGSLPARRADLERRIRNERTKIFKLMESYGIFNVGVSFQLLDIVNSSNGMGSQENTLLATSSSSQTLQETVSALFGHSILKSLTEVDMSLDTMLERVYGMNLCQWGIRGLLSKGPSMQQATQKSSSKGNNNNRLIQFYSINGRVVDLPKVTDLLRKLWKALGGKKRPHIILDITLPNEAFDINLSPDKQTVLLTHEREFLNIIQEYASDLWSSSSTGVFVVSKVPETYERSQSGHDNIGLVDDDDENDNCESDDVDRQMHKRRFAFVHDLSNAKMQHDLEERQMCNNETQTLVTESAVSDEAGVIENTFPSANTSPSTDSDVANEEPERKRAKVSVAEVSGCAAQTEDVSLSDPEIPISTYGLTNFRLTDKDRRQWIETQAQFRRSSRCNDSIEFVRQGYELNSVPEDEYASSRVSPDKFQISPADGTKCHGGSSIPISQKGILPINISVSKELHQTDMNQFAFKPRERIPTQNAFGGGKQRRCDDSAGNVRHQDMSTKRQVSIELSTSIEVLNEQKRQDDYRNKEVNVTVQEDERTARSKVHDNDEQDRNDIQESMVVERTRSAVLWKSFQSTEQVCIDSRLERYNMIDRKRDLDSMRNDNCMPQTAGVEEEIEKKVGCIDGNEDKDTEDSLSFIRISKDTFRREMIVIGQFNLGFILAKCARNHLWILDQHACDEKYNFEQLCKTTVMHEQPLIQPLPLELSPSEEACVLDHMDIFEANGFRFKFDPNAPIRHRLALKALPHSGATDGQKAVQFGPSDVRALCSILTDGTSYDPGDGGTGTDGSGLYGNNAVRRHASSSSRMSHSRSGDKADTILARLPKAIAMFASRACRKSIMIGTSMSQKEMDGLVRKLADVDMPFTCAHGRPTMRHVGNVLTTLLQDERRATEYIATPTITMTPFSQSAEYEVVNL